jgi:hypothetical protein
VAEHQYRTATADWHLHLQPQPEGKDGVFPVTMMAQDSTGETVPYAESRIDFKLSGPAQLLAHENGNPTDVTQHQAGWRNLFAGMSRSFYCATDTTGSIELAAAGVLGYTPFQHTTTVSLAFTRVPLRGSLTAANFEIRYTLNGSEPTTNSPIATGPLGLSEPALVRMVVFRNGQPYISSESRFEKGLPKKYDDPRYEQTTSTSIVFPTGPLDKEVVGLWSAGSRKLRLLEDGLVLRVSSTAETEVGRWWYNFPDDAFEDKTAVGAGALQWNDSHEVSTIRLQSPARTHLLLKTGNKETVFHHE